MPSRDWRAASPRQLPATNRTKQIESALWPLTARARSPSSSAQDSGSVTYSNSHNPGLPKQRKTIVTSDTTRATVIKPIKLSRQAYERYGTVIGADESLPFKLANMGTAKRFNDLADVQNRRPDARLNMCVFRCSAAKLPLEIKLLEKHEHSTQIFLPMNASASYLAIVCLGGDAPDLNALSAFLVEGPQGISYAPGVWHYPMTPLNEPIDFACLVAENDSAQDCTIHNFEVPLTILAQ
jgi:ureidoglycolate lyase